jgi:hypothetical protein
MEQPTKMSSERRGFRDLWTVFCAAMLIGVVIYAVLTAS